MNRVVPILMVAAWSLFAMGQQPQVRQIPAENTSAFSGEEMYMSYCASCHGRQGRGDGPAAPALKPSPSDLTRLARGHNGKFPYDLVYQAIRTGPNIPAHGSADMPVWGPIFHSLVNGHSDDTHLRIVNLTKYIEKLQTR